MLRTRVPSRDNVGFQPRPLPTPPAMDQGAADKTNTAADKIEVTAGKSDGALDTAAEASTTGVEQAAEPDDQTSGKPFQFLDLAPELRNAVYAAILEDQPATIPRNHRRPLKMSSALVGVNKMIHDEFLSYATLASPVIRAIVSDLCFAHVITYMNQLGETQLKQLQRGSGTKESATQTIKIELRLADEEYEYDYGYDCTPVRKLNRWLNRFDVGTKRAAEVRLEYEAKKSDTELCRDVASYLRRTIDIRQQRSRVEALKIMWAFQRAWELGLRTNT